MIQRPAARLAGLAAALALSAPSIAAKTIAYPVDPAILALPADQLGLVPSPAPPRGTRPIMLTVQPAVDHAVVRVGMLGDGKTLLNPLATLARGIVADRAAPEAPGGATLRIGLDRAATLVRCVIVGELKGTCIVRVTLDGTAGNGADAPARPLHVMTERSIKGVLISNCVAVVSREAMLDYLAKAEAIG